MIGGLNVIDMTIKSSWAWALEENLTTAGAACLADVKISYNVCSLSP